jgi:hypothetical protein
MTLESHGHASTAESPFGTSFDRVAAPLAALVLVVVPTLLLINDEPIDHGLFSGLRVSMSASAAVLGGTIPGFLNIRSARIKQLTRAAGALVLAVATIAFVPDVLTKFDEPLNWFSASSATFGLGGLFLSILSSVAAAYSFRAMKLHKVTSVINAEDREVIHKITLTTAKFTLNEDEKLIDLLKRIETANTSMQMELSNADDNTTTKGD